MAAPVRNGLQLSVAPLTLAGLDALSVPDLAAFVAADERPLQGLAGLVDWRMCGALTRLVKAGHFAGNAGENLLTVSGGRLPAGRVFLFGAGTEAQVRKGRPGAWLFEAFATVARAGGRAVATSLPGVGDVPVGIFARALTEAARENGLERVVLLHLDERAADRALAVAAETFPGVQLGA